MVEIEIEKQIGQAIFQELDWLNRVIRERYKIRFERSPEVGSIWDISPPDLSGNASYYSKFIAESDLGFPERLTLILALAPHLHPQILDPLYIKNPDTDMPFTEFGGVRGQQFNGMLPTAQTALHLLSEGHFDRYHRLRKMFDQEHLFARKNVLDLQKAERGEPEMSGILTVMPDFLDAVLVGQARRPKFGPEFPAREVETVLEWSDLVLAPNVFKQLEEIRIWLKYNDVLLEDWGMGKVIKPGYRVLFYGPPGTGKTLCATLLGKEIETPVFRVDLSMIVSKYIGETEKNLARIFDAAQDKNWVLFFDEADALFGKRTKVSDSHDRYANQEVSYLLQRVEDYRGLVILATNLKGNMDEAFTRRFQSTVHFPLPRPEERLKIWKNTIPAACTIGEDLDLVSISNKYELSGGSIVNVVHYCALQAASREKHLITKHDIMLGIRREFEKEGKTI